MGSDHDVFNFFGIPSVMSITWPDRFYHSSEDTIDKVSKATIELIGKAVLATALALAKAEKDELQRFARGYAMKYLGELGRERDTETVERLVMMGLARTRASSKSRAATTLREGHGLSGLGKVSFRRLSSVKLTRRPMRSLKC